MSYVRRKGSLGLDPGPLSDAQRALLAQQAGGSGGSKSWLNALQTFFGGSSAAPAVSPPFVATAPVAASGTSIAVKLAIGAGVLGAAAYFIAKRK